MKYLLKYLNVYRAPFLFALFFLTLEATCDLLQPTIMSSLIDEGVKESSLPKTLYFGLMMLIVTILGACFALSRNFLASSVSQRFSRDLRLDLFSKVQKLSFQSIDEIEQASLITRLTNDVTQIQNFSFGLMRVFVKAPILCIGAIVMMAIMDWDLTLVLLAVIPITILLISLSMKISYPYFLKVQKALDHVNTVMREYLTGIRVVKAFNSYSHEENRFNKESLTLQEATVKTMRVMAYFNPGIALAVNLGIVAIIYFGGIKVNQGDLEVGKIMAFVMYMTQVLNAISMMTAIFNMFIRAKASSQRVEEVLYSTEAPGIEKTEDITDFNELSVRFSDVSFSYSDTAPILKKLNFHFKQGETIGIIGSTGAGKSTLLYLMMRLYEIKEGHIFINGLDIKAYSKEQLCHLISIVPQKSFLFSGTILDNLQTEETTYSINEIKKATQVACANEFILNLPEGYDTYLGQGGVNLSGGQKQRLCIARALLRKPQILIFDDATSAIDVSTEKKIRMGLKEYTKGSMIFIVSQRLSTIMDCDQIMVIENGEIVGMGKHEELMSDCNVYKDIYKSQIGSEDQDGKQ